MLQAIKTISDQALQIINDRGGDPCTLQDITNVIEAYTKIDEILFVCYEAPPDNPIWGGFQRWEQFQPYQGERTLVEVRYADHLTVHWRRFVVCKELCHALDSRRGTHTASDVEVTELITELALASAASANGNPSTAGSAEIIAQAGAIEILLPLPIRLQMVDGIGNSMDNALIQAIADQHQLPVGYVRLAFQPTYISMMQNIFAQFE